jgi:hypothetical protein
MASSDVIKTFIQNSPVAGMYTEAVDRESAYEILKGRSVKQDTLKNPDSRQGERTSRPDPREESSRSSNRQGLGEALVKSVIRAVGSQVGRQIATQVIRGVLGGLTRR